MDIFQFKDYRSAIATLFEERKKGLAKWTVASLAEALNIQASYITNTLNGRAHFNSDQIYSICEYLNLSSEEREHLLELLEYEKSVISKRKAELLKKITERKQQSLKTERHLKTKVLTQDMVFEEYYLNPLCQVIHVFLNFPSYAAKPEKISEKLGISLETLEESIKILEKLKIIKKEKNKYEVLIRNKHLSKDSKLHDAHQFLLRYKSIDQMQRLGKKDRYNFSVTFSSSEADKQKIQRHFLEFISFSEKTVKTSTRENIYQINFDLFPWEL